MSGSEYYVVFDNFAVKQYATREQAAAVNGRHCVSIHPKPNGYITMETDGDDGPKDGWLVAGRWSAWMKTLRTASLEVVVEDPSGEIHTTEVVCEDKWESRLSALALRLADMSRFSSWDSYLLSMRVLELEQENAELKSKLNAR